MRMSPFDKRENRFSCCPFLSYTIPSGFSRLFLIIFHHRIKNPAGRVEIPSGYGFLGLAVSPLVFVPGEHPVLLDEETAHLEAGVDDDLDQDPGNLSKPGNKDRETQSWKSILRNQKWVFGKQSKQLYEWRFSLYVQNKMKNTMILLLVPFLYYKKGGIL